MRLLYARSHLPGPARILGALALLALLGACGIGRGPLFRAPPLEHRRPAPPPLPDEAERTAARLSALVLANRPDSAAAALQELVETLESLGSSDGTALVDNSRDLLHTLSGRSGYRKHAAQMLEQELDPMLRRRLESTLEQEPLRQAEKRLREDRTRKAAAVVNRMVGPLSRAVLGGGLQPLETGRAALQTFLSLRRFPEATLQERQALRAYRRFLEENPEAEEAEWVVEQIARYQRKLQRQLYGESIEAAERALEAGRPDVCLAHLERAERAIPEESDTRRLRRVAVEALEERRARVNRALSVYGPREIGAERQLLFETHALTAAALVASTDELAGRARAWRERHGEGPLSDELAFLEALDLLERGREDAFYDAMERIADLGPESSNMARHALWLLTDPDQNPYLQFRRARRADRSQRLAYLLVGRPRWGPRDMGLPRPVEWILGAPGMVISLVMMPLRVIQYPSVRARFGAAVIDAGERYVARFPSGAHAEEVHGKLEGIYADRGSWNRALEHHQARPERVPKTVARYRERVAEQTLAAAQLERRWDVRLQLYRFVLKEYAGTPQAAEAGEELYALLQETTPQNIRLSRGFLEENPELWGPGALGLRRELLDGDEDNGELAEEGITLLGQTQVRIALEGADPVVESVPKENFVRLVALLQEADYRRLATDARERPNMDPQRDLFFERARLGLLNEPDVRPTASSDAAFLSTRERYGYFGRRDSILPVELVVAGDLEGFGLSAYPRIKVPPETDDAWLYK